MFTILKRNPAFSPLSYGAVGDGVTNDHTAVNAAMLAARAAGGYVIIPSGYTFGIGSYLSFLNGDKGIIGKGGTIKTLAASSGVLLSGKAQGRAENVDGMLVEGLNIDASGGLLQAIYLSGSTNCRIIGNHITNLDEGTGILIRCFSVADGAPTDNLVEHNIIEGDTGEDPLHNGINVSGYLDYTPYASATLMWKGLFSIDTAAGLPALRNTIRYNRITGGYYGISMDFAQDSEIAYNVIASNMRNISVQNRSDNNRVHHNNLSESISSGIHLAFGSSDNDIIGNRIVTTRGVGEGLLQAYVGCNDNEFVGNYTNCPGPSTGNKYHAYIAVQSNGNRMDRNVHSGLCLKAYVAVESAWDGDVTNDAHRNDGLGTTNDGYTGGDITDNVLECVTISGSSAVPAIFLSQINQDGTWGQTGTVLNRNRIVGNTYSKQLELYEATSSELVSLVATSNVFDASADSSKFTLPRDRAGHFSTDTGNNWPGGVT